MFALFLIVVFSKRLWDFPDSYKVIWTTGNQVLFFALGWIRVRSQWVNDPSVPLDRHDVFTVLELVNFHWSCVSLGTCCVQVIAYKFNPETTQFAGFELVYHLFWNLAVILVSIKFQQFLVNLWLIFLLSPVLCRNEPVNVLLILFLLFKYTLGELVILDHPVFRFVTHNQLNTQESFILFMIVPHKIVVHWWYVTIVKHVFPFFVSVLVLKQLHFCPTNVVLSNTDWT